MRARLLLSSLLLSLFVLSHPAAPSGAQMTEPVDGQVVDAFRPPAHIGAPGNRGWEYRTVPGTVVRAAGDGRVVFAGPIGSALYVSVQHRDGLRTTYSYLDTITVAVGDRVAAGVLVGTSASRFHFGARRRGAYIDPASLFAADVAFGPVRLVPRRLVGVPESAS